MERIDAMIDSMTPRERVSQLFFLSLSPEGGPAHTTADDALGSYIEATQAGGYVLFGEQVTTVESTKALTEAVRAHSKIPPFVGIDEEGGIVSRLVKLPGYQSQPTAQSIGRGGNPADAYRAGVAIGAALRELGINLDFAPCADVLTNPSNTVIGSRSYGGDPELVAEMAAAFSTGLGDQNLLTCPKHFPGHGATAADSHYGPAVTYSDDATLDAVEYVPFRRLIGEGVPFVMLGHIQAPAADDSGLPASLSPYFATEVLREELGYTGIITTDAMNMGAITGSYSPEEAAVLAFAAGVDMVLMPEDFDRAVEGVLAALEEGVLTEERLRESLRRVIGCKVNAEWIS